MPRNPTLFVLFSMFAVNLHFADSCHAAEFHARKRCNRQCLPKYRYATAFPQRNVPFVKVVSEAAVPYDQSQQTIGQRDVAVEVVTKTQSGGVTTTRIERYHDKRSPQSDNVREKRFVIDDAAVGPVTVSGLRARLDERGRAVLTGLITHSGGDTGALKGGMVTVQVQSLAANPDAPSPRGPVLWDMQQRFWVRKGEPLSLRIASSDKTRDFDQVTHIQVMVTYRSSRFD